MPNALARSLTARIALAGSLRALSAELGVSKSHLSRVARGARPGPRLLALLGWVEILSYAPRVVDIPDSPRTDAPPGMPDPPG